MGPATNPANLMKHVVSMEKDSLLAGMDTSLQFYAISFGSWQKTSSFMFERRMKNVMTLYT